MLIIQIVLPPLNLLPPVVYIRHSESLTGGHIHSNTFYSLVPSTLIKLKCMRIRREGGIYGKIWPKPKGYREGSGHILPFIPTQVLVRTLSYS